MRPHSGPGSFCMYVSVTENHEREVNVLMKKRTKKLLSLLLAIAMMLSLAPLSVFAADDPAPAEPTEEVGTGTVIAVVYGKVMNDTLEGLLNEQSDKPLFNPSRFIVLLKDDGFASGLKYAFDTVPNVDFALENAAGEQFSLTPDSQIKGSEYIEDLTTGKQLKEDLDEIGVSKDLIHALDGNGLTVYKAEVPAGEYTFSVNSIDEPYGLANNDYLTQTVEVKADETVVVGESKTLNGYMTENQGSLFRPKYVDVDHSLTFTGFWLRKETRGFTFRTTDVAEDAVAGSEFVLINRDEIDAILQILISLGKDLFESGLQNVSELKFDEVVALHQGLIKQGEDGMIALDAEKAQEVMQAYLAFAMGIVEDANVKEKFITTAEDGSFKLNAPLPAVLAATSNADGVVSFTEDNNITLTWMLSIVNQLLEKAGDALNLDDNWMNMLDLLGKLSDKPNPDDYANGESDLEYIAKKWIYDTAYDAAYALLKNFGVVGEKMSNGHYLMFQYSVPEGYQRSPLVYTLDIEWVTPSNVYVKVADLGIVGPYFAEGFYDFVRGTNYEGPVAKALGMAANGYGTAYTFSNGNLYLTQKLHDIMTGKIEDAKVKGALTAYLADATYRVLGLNLLYSTKVGLMQGYNDYLKQNQQMNLDLQAYVNKLAKKAKAVYTADLTPVENEDGSVDYWTFYTLDSSPTLTATKLINQSTKNIAAAMPEGSEKQAGVLQNGATISNIVNKVGTRIEEANKKVAQNIQSALTKAFGDIGAKLKEGVTKLVGSLFSNLFGGGANQTAGA